MKEFSENVKAGFEKFGKTLSELSEKNDLQWTSKALKMKGQRKHHNTGKS